MGVFDDLEGMAKGLAAVQTAGIKAAGEALEPWMRMYIQCKCINQIAKGDDKLVDDVYDATSELTIRGLHAIANILPSRPEPKVPKKRYPRVDDATWATWSEKDRETYKATGRRPAKKAESETDAA